jgi:UDP-N-acetylglucosamine 2-epimerase (non-hydrolysing)
MTTKILLSCGARPNFMKIAPVQRLLSRRLDCDSVLVHTGQHFDREMSQDFFDVLELPAPDVHLGVGGAASWEQLSSIIAKLTPVLIDARPDVVVVAGDVMSTLATGLAAATLDIPVAHIEAGLRSRDWAMPEEKNRVLTDRLSRILFTPSADADENLHAEGITEGIHLVGNVMIDSLEWILPRLDPARVLEAYDVTAGEFGLVTLHRQSNVEDRVVLEGIVRALTEIARDLTLLFPVHPRTQARLTEYGISLDAPGLVALPPISYDHFTALTARAALVLTDSGGIQEESVVVGTPCLTLRENTERPITLVGGMNELVGTDPDRIVKAAAARVAGGRGAAQRPPLWDGRAAERIVDVLVGDAERARDIEEGVA